MKKGMKIGLDFHGVIDVNPKFWKHYTQQMTENGHEIHIVTGGELTSDFLKKLKDMGITYTKVFSIVNDARERGIEITYKNDEPFMDDNIWKRSKGMYAKMMRLNMHIDDTLSYSHYFPKHCEFILWK